MFTRRNESIANPSAPFYNDNRIPPIRLLKKDALIYTDSTGRMYYEAKKIPFCQELCEQYIQTLWVVKAPKGQELVVPMPGDWIDEKYEVCESGSGLLVKPGMRKTSFVTVF